MMALLLDNLQEKSWQSEKIITFAFLYTESFSKVFIHLAPDGKITFYMYAYCENRHIKI